MTTKSLHCTVITPEAQVYDGPVDAVIIPAHDGEIGILHNRAALLCKLGFGRMRLRSGEREESWYVDAGFAQVLDNVVTVLTPNALRPEQIDRAVAETALTEARRLPVIDEVSERRKREAIARARAQLRIAPG